MTDLIVQKFGGSSVARPEQIVAIAKKISELHKAGRKLIVVVSAMGKTTDELISLAHKVSAYPDRRELDMLLSTGERVSMALLSMALKDLQCPSISFTGSQAGVLTDGSHSNANIVDVRPIRVAEALANNKVVVLAGFQGVDPVTKEITTLGRGGSDTTAVAMSAHFKAERCEILKDVDGIFSADPKIVANATLYQRFPLETLFDMCFWGAKVLHSRSVDLAIKEKVILAIGRSDNFKIGTNISPLLEGGFDFKPQQVLTINSHKEVHHLHIHSQSEAEASDVLKQILETEKMPWPQILLSVHENHTTRFKYTGDSEFLAVLKPALFRSNRCQPQEKVLAAVTATCFGSVDPTVPAKMAEALVKLGIDVQKTLINPTSVTFFIPAVARDQAVHELHSFVKK